MSSARREDALEEQGVLGVRRAYVATEGIDRPVAGPDVERDRFRLARAGLQPERSPAQLPRGVLEPGEHRLADAAAPSRRGDVHPLHLGDPATEEAQRAAGD